MNAAAKQQPDLNYRSPMALEKIKKIFNFWLGKGAGGFRIDAINHLYEFEDLRDEPLSGTTNDSKSYDYTLHHYTKDLPEMYEMVYEFRKVTDEFQKKNGGNSRILMTEAYCNDTEFPKYYKSKDGSKTGSQMPFNFVFISDLAKYTPVVDMKKMIDNKMATVPNGTRLNWVFGNHDTPRFGSRLGEQKIDGLLTLVMTLPGIAVTYMVSFTC